MPRSNARPSQAITIHDVAAEAGVSYGTVSRVINNDIHVKDETRARVLQAVGDLGYVINRQARSLAGGASHTIGVLVPDLGTGYIGEIIRGIDMELGLANYDLMLYTSHRTAEKEAEFIKSLAQGMVDGVILVLPRNPHDYTPMLLERDFPFVLVDHVGSGENFAAVCATNWQGAYHATEYLVKLGHTRIGLIGGDMSVSAGTDRLAGYQAALRAHHILQDASLIIPGNFNQPDGYDGACTLFDLPHPPTAIFACNDMMAFGVMDAARDRGMHIPADISIIGFDDIAQAALAHPPLTTVRQPLEQMGRIASQIILDMLRDSNFERKRIDLPTELIVRETCRKLE
jgi:LacI family transcriptional regulator